MKTQIMKVQIMKLQMMKIQIFVLFAFLVFNSLEGQKTISDGRMWNELESSQFSPNFSTSIYSFKNDTLINSLEYKELFVKTDTLPTSNWISSNDFLREDSLHRIYAIENNVEKLLYDFNLVENDTFTVDFDDFYCELKVYLIDSVELLNGDLRKRIRLARLENPDPSEPWGDYIDWIQGVGSVTSLLRYGGSCYLDFNVELLCFFENDELVYTRPDNSGCFLTPIENFDQTSKLKIYPNPANSLLHIETNIEKLDISIFSLDGKIRLKSTQKTMDISTLDPGMYFVLIKNDGMSNIAKLIVE